MTTPPPERAAPDQRRGPGRKWGTGDEVATSHLAAAVAAVLTLAGCAGAGAFTAGASTVPANAPALERDYVSVVKRVLPSVVQITTGHDLGSGVIFDTKGDIVTNDHVVGSATKFQVRLAASYPASLVGAYPPDDLAVIRLDSPPAGLRPAHFGDSGGPAAAAGIQVGEVITAVNNSPVRTTSDLSTALAQLNPGHTVPVTIIEAQGQTRTVMVTLGQLPGS